jgi:WD40 repeat protein
VVWNVSDGTRRWNLSFSASSLLRYRGCSFSPDGSALVTAHHKPGRGGRGGFKGASYLQRSDSASGKPTTAAKQVLATHHTSFAASCDGSLYALATGDGDVAVFDSDFKRVMLRTAVHSLFITDIAFTPAADQLLTTSGDYTFLRTQIVRDPINVKLWLALMVLVVLFVALVLRLV